jgi:hypothetical protein
MKKKRKRTSKWWEERAQYIGSHRWSVHTCNLQRPTWGSAPLAEFLRWNLAGKVGHSILPRKTAKTSRDEELLQFLLPSNTGK